MGNTWILLGKGQKGTLLFKEGLTLLVLLKVKKERESLGWFISFRPCLLMFTCAVNYQFFLHVTVPSKYTVTCWGRLPSLKKKNTQGKKYGKHIKMCVLFRFKICILFRFSSANIKHLKLFISQTSSWFIINENGNIMRQGSLCLLST